MAVGEADNRRATSDDVLPAGPVLLTVPEVARRLSLGRATTYLLVQRGELPVVRIGRAVRAAGVGQGAGPPLLLTRRWRIDDPHDRDGLIGSIWRAPEAPFRDRRVWLVAPPGWPRRAAAPRSSVGVAHGRHRPGSADDRRPAGLRPGGAGRPASVPAPPNRDPERTPRC
jgi:excisionase family DNA binding protein